MFICINVYVHMYIFIPRHETWKVCALRHCTSAVAQGGVYVMYVYLIINMCMYVRQYSCMCMYVRKYARKYALKYVYVCT